MSYRKSEAAAVKKRIIVCSDGTWQSSTSDKFNIPSNVTRLTRNLATAGHDEHGNIVPQVVFYDAGIATGSITDTEKARQGGTGDGLALNVLEAYNFIAVNYNKGDEIYCFGFSRGAYTARAVSGLVTDIGILDRRQLQRLPDLYEAYKTNYNSSRPFLETESYRYFKNGQGPKGERNFNGLDKPEPLEEFDNHMQQWKETRSVKVVGVWDTVGSLGVPYIPNLLEKWQSGWAADEHRFHNVKFSEYIEHGFHALALDERRKPFAPAMWYIPHNTASANGGDSHSHATRPRLLQVWFPGVHINIGGGSDNMLKEFKGDLEQISNLTFAWMMEQVSPFLAFENNAFEQDLIDHEKLLSEISQRVIIEKGWLWNSEVKRDVKRGWANGPIIDSFGGLMALGGSEIRRPGETTTPVFNNGKWESVLTRELGETHEQIHPTVTFRDGLRDTEGDDLYEPQALDGWVKPPTTDNLKRDKSLLAKCKNETRFTYTKKIGKADVHIPEYKIGKEEENFERMAALQGGHYNVAQSKEWSNAKEFLELRDYVNFV